MGIELITGMGGTNHVDSEDVGALNAELIGNGNYLLSGCEVTMTDANTCHVAAGELLLQGRHVRIKGAGEDVSIGNGQAGYNQRYLICLVYSKATNGIETVGLQAFAGTKTTGTATDPAVAVGSILGGDTNVVVPLARLELTGLSVGTPAVMLDSVKGLVALGAETKKLGDSVSQNTKAIASQPVTKRIDGGIVSKDQYGIAKMIVGTAIVKVNNSSQAKLFTAAQFKAIAGRAFDKTKDFVGVMNGDYHDSMSAHVEGAGYYTDGSIYAVLDGNWNTSLRINYLIVLGA